MAISHKIRTERPLPDRSMQAAGGRRRVPPNLFGITFGLAGLGEAWNAARQPLRVPRAVPDAIFLVAAVAWLVLVTAYAAQVPNGRYPTAPEDPVRNRELRSPRRSMRYHPRPGRRDFGCLF